MAARLTVSEPIDVAPFEPSVYPGDTWQREVALVDLTTTQPLDLSDWTFAATLGGVAGTVDASAADRGRLVVRFEPDATEGARKGTELLLRGTHDDGGVRTFARGVVGSLAGSSVPRGTAQKLVRTTDSLLEIRAGARGDRGASGEAVSLTIRTAAEAAQASAVTARDAAAGHAQTAGQAAGAAGVSAGAAASAATAASGSAAAAFASAGAAGDAANRAAAARAGVDQLVQDAAASKSAAGQSAFSAGASAAAAQGSEDAARSARVGAEAGRAGAEAAQGAAEAARDLALSGQFAGTAIAAGTDINTLVTPGMYFQNVAGNATTALNFPAQVRGVLQVTRTLASRIVQRFTPQNFGSPLRGEWLRTLEATTWSPWAFVAAQRINNPAGQPGVEVFTWDDQNARDQLMQTAYVDLGNADLNTITVAGTYGNVQSGSSLNGRNYPVALAGVLEVLRVNAAPPGNNPPLIQRYTGHSGGAGPVEGFFQRRFNAGIWTAWTWVSKIRFDETAGRAAFAFDIANGREQLIYGDTGWRDIRSLLVNGWTATGGGVLIRRVGQQVSMMGYRLDGTAATSLYFVDAASIPNGFRFSVGSFRATVQSGTAQSNFGLNSTGYFLPTGAVIGPDAYWQVSWLTTEPWPTSLPGAALGVVPA